MAIDNEELYPLRATEKWMPRVESESLPSVPTANRWAVNGLLSRDGHRVKLETILIGRRRYTSKEAALRFIAARNAADQPSASTADVASETAANGRAAAKALAGMGI